MPPFLQEAAKFGLFLLSFNAVGSQWGILGLLGLLLLFITPDRMRQVHTQARADGWTSGLLVNALVTTVLTAIPIASATTSAILAKGELWGIALGALWLAWFLTASGEGKHGKEV